MTEWFQGLPLAIRLIIGVPIGMLLMALMAFILTELPAAIGKVIMHYWEAFWEIYRQD